MDDDTGGPAFPRPYSQHNDLAVNTSAFDEQEGMMLVDYYAGKAMSAIVSSDAWTVEAAGIELIQPHHVAREAYAIADAMLAERARRRSTRTAGDAMLAEALRELITRYEFDGIPNDSLPTVEAARRALAEHHAPARSAQGPAEHDKKNLSDISAVLPQSEAYSLTVAAG